MSPEENAEFVRYYFKAAFAKMLQDNVAYVCTVGLAPDGAFEIYKGDNVTLEDLREVADYLIRAINKYQSNGN